MDANTVNASGNVLAKEVMTTEVISVLPETPVKEVARLMIDNK
ncbi:MAG: CBS domain-containing protein, partial [Acidaminococcaceae bacterium]|nr:CBS domain-containing protein [Acidaminococcaceae bacterium]